MINGKQFAHGDDNTLLLVVHISLLKIAIAIAIGRVNYRIKSTKLDGSSWWFLTLTTSAPYYRVGSN